VQGHFDLVMGSDVLYERDDGGMLSAFIQRHALPVAQVLIVDPDRGNRSAFSRRMADLGFALAEHRLNLPPLPGNPYKGRLLHFQRNPRPPPV